MKTNKSVYTIECERGGMLGGESAGRAGVAVRCRERGVVAALRGVCLVVALAFCFGLATAGEAAHVWKAKPERLSYDVMYKWGLINKKAGDVEMTTQVPDGKGEFSALLTAKSASWADRFFMVRDTLRGRIESATLLPRYYEKISHEGGAFSKDILRFNRSGEHTRADATRWRRGKKAVEMSVSTAMHEAQGTTLDMLSSFYYMRNIDYGAMEKGESVKMNIFSGKRKELLTITYHGLDRVKVGKSEREAYHITFTFTTEGGKVSSDKMDAWIGTGERRLPLLLEGKLPVGKVRAVYSGEL